MARPEVVYQKKIQPRLKEIFWWCREGATMKEIAENLDTNERQMYRCMAAHLELRNAVREGKEIADHKIEDSLYIRARGKTYTETIDEEEEGVRGDKPYKLKRKRTTTKEIPPDTHASIFWLKNRQPRKWKDKFEQTTHQKVVILYDVSQPKKKKQEQSDSS